MDDYYDDDDCMMMMMRSGRQQGRTMKKYHKGSNYDYAFDYPSTEDMADFDDDYYYDYEDMGNAATDKISECLSKMPEGKTVDFMLDFKSDTLKEIPKNLMYYFGGDPMFPEEFPQDMAENVAEIFDELSNGVENKMLFQGIILDGSTKRYFSHEKPAEQQKNQNSRRPMLKPAMFWDYEEEALSTAAENMKQGLTHYLQGKGVSSLPTERPNATVPIFTVILTDATQGTDPESYPTPNLILDIFGLFANSTVGYTKPNVIIADPPEMLYSLMPTIRYQACQQLGGISN